MPPATLPPCPPPPANPPAADTHAARITDADVRHVAKLSRLRLDDSEVHHFAQQLAAVLEYVDALRELDVEGVEPMAHPLAMTNVLREDVPEPGLDVDAALANAPGRDGPFFSVPKVLGDGGGA